jgi:hypothetical protein
MAGRGLTFPVAYGVSREESEVFGAWWDSDRGFIQPAEFLLGRGGIVLGSMYASGPVGRMGADEAVRLIPCVNAAAENKGRGRIRPASLLPEAMSCTPIRPAEYGR